MGRVRLLKAITWGVSGLFKKYVISAIATSRIRKIGKESEVISINRRMI